MWRARSVEILQKFKAALFPVVSTLKMRRVNIASNLHVFTPLQKIQIWGRGTGFRIFVNDYLYHSFSVYISIERIISKTFYCIADFDSSFPKFEKTFEKSLQWEISLSSKKIDFTKWHAFVQYDLRIYIPCNHFVVFTFQL